MIFKANNKRTKKKWKDLPKVNRNIQMAWQTLLWYHCCQTDLILDIPLIFKNGRRRKWSTKNANLKNTRSRFSTPWQILKWSFLLKLLTNLNCKLFLWQVLSSPLTAINQMFLTNNKRVTYHSFLERWLLLRSQDFTCSNSAIETLKTPVEDVKCVWS